MSYMSAKSIDIIEQGEEAWFNGTANPYDKGTEEYSLWEKGWHAENRRQECRADAEC